MPWLLHPPTPRPSKAMRLSNEWGTMNSHSVVGLLLFYRARYRVLSGVDSYGFMPARSRFSRGERLAPSLYSSQSLMTIGI